MEKKLISLELDDSFPFDLAKDMVNYIKKKKIKKVKIRISEELKEPIEKTYSEKDFDALELDIANCLDTEGHWLSITLPEIKTSWEQFTYGVDANSYEEDFKKTFSKYQ